MRSARTAADSGCVRVELGADQAATSGLEEPGVLEYHRLAGRLEDGRVGELRDEVVSGLDDLIDVDVEGLPHLRAAGGSREEVSEGLGAGEPRAAPGISQSIAPHRPEPEPGHRVANRSIPWSAAWVTSRRLTILDSVSRSRGGRRESSAETSASKAAAACETNARPSSV